MCGILAKFNDWKLKTTDLASLEKRGLDNFGITNFQDINHYFKLNRVEIPEKFIFQNLHKIVGNFKQPTHFKNYFFAANCEIYNYKELNPKAKNDTAVLFKLLANELVKIEHEENYLENANRLIKETLQKVDGVYSFVLYNKLKNIVFICKDMFGVKPLKYIFDEGLVIASEAKLLEKLKENNESQAKIENLDGNTLISFDLNNNEKQLTSIRELKLPKKYSISKEMVISELNKLMPKAIEKRIPDVKFAILFSGGIDSTLIAAILKQLGKEFVCYSASFQDGNTQISPDIQNSIQVCKEMGIDFKYININLAQLESDISKVANIIEDVDPIKLGVALPFYYATQLANKDGIKVIFSGIGSEELFAGYQRHLNALENNQDVNQECLKGLEEIQFRDLYRDDLITMSNNVELRLPFLDYNLAKYSLKIDPKLKINSEQKKIILRDFASQYNIPDEIVNRKKLGAQYGSNFDKGIAKLAKKYSKTKKDYVNGLKCGMN